jgi:hypothetical protein
MAKPAVTTPAPRRSPARPAAAGSGWPAMPATDASQTPCTSGRSARCAAHPAPAPTTNPYASGARTHSRDRTGRSARRYQRAATTITSAGNRKPAKAAEEATRRDTALHASPLKPALIFPSANATERLRAVLRREGNHQPAPYTVHHFSERAMLRSFMIKASHHGSGGYKVRLTSRGKPTSTRCGAYCALTGINPRCRNKPSHPGSG